MQWILGAVAVVVLYEVIKAWGWKRGWQRTEEDINRLPQGPGVYVLHFPGLGGAVYVGSTNNLRRRLREHRRHKPGWSTFDWQKTQTVQEAQDLERRLQEEVGQRSRE